MDTVSVWRFDTPEEAEAVLPLLTSLAADVDDAAVVSWPAQHRKPTTRSLGRMTGPGRLWGGFWDVLFGVVFLIPIAAPSLGAAAGAVSDSLADFGLGDEFAARVREAVGPGSSALFVLSGRAAADRLSDALPGTRRVTAELSYGQAAYLREALAEEPA